MRVKRQTSAEYVEPQRPGDSVISFRGSPSPGKGTECNISKLSDDLWKWFEILRTRSRTSAAAGFPMLRRVADDRESSLRRLTLAVAVSPVGPSAALMARCNVSSAQGTQRGQRLDNGFFTFEPVSKVDEEISLLQSFHKKTSTPRFTIVTPQVMLSGDTCVRTRTVLSSNPLSMDIFAGAKFPRECTPRVTSIFKGPARCSSSHGGQPANLVRQRIVSCQRPAEADLVGSETDSRLSGCAENSTPVWFEIGAICVPGHVPERPPEPDCRLCWLGLGKRWWIASENM